MRPDLSRPPATVGNLLREAREEHGIDLETFARSLRVPIRMLRALEEGEFAVLPADVYVRGFVKLYAEALHLDPVPLLRQLATERSRFSAAPAAARRVHSGLPRPRLAVFLAPRSLAVVGGVVGLSAVLLYLAAQVLTYARPPRLTVHDPSRDLEFHGTDLAIRGQTDPTAEALVNGERVLVREDGTFEHTVRVRDGVNTVRVIARSLGGRETVLTRDVLVTRPAGPVSPVVPRGPVTLTVRAEGQAVWVALTVDGREVFSGLLPPEGEQTARGERVVVTSGLASRTRLLSDGEDLGTLGTAPVVLRGVVFTRNPQTGKVERHEPSEVPSG